MGALTTNEDTGDGPRRGRTVTAKNETVSRQMSRMPRKNSGPEIELRKALHSRGLRFRTHPALPGRPDIVFTRAKLAVFVDGCFWHGCSEHGTMPKNNSEWWREKLEANVARDRRKDAELRNLGWVVLHIWEHEAAVDAAEAIEDVWRSRTGRPRAGCEGGDRM